MDGCGWGSRKTGPLIDVTGAACHEPRSPRRFASLNATATLARSGAPASPGSLLGVWSKMLAWVDQTTGITSYPVIFTAVFAVGVSIPVALLALAAKVAALGNLEGTFKNFARFGYALIPLDVAAHVAHNLFHLLAEGNSVFYTVTALFGAHNSGPTALVGNGTIQVLQFALLALGLTGSLYTVKRIAHRRYLSPGRRLSTMVPFAVLIGVLAVLNVAMFTVPMTHRM